MSKFKVGDIVRYYGAFNEELEIERCEVIAVEPNGLLRVESSTCKFWAHPRQCKRLKRKKKGKRISGTCIWMSLEGIPTPVWAGPGDIKASQFAKLIDERTKITIEVLK